METVFRTVRAQRSGIGALGPFDHYSGQCFGRKAGEALHPEREPLEMLD
jgi:hypothetical protein